MRHRADSLPVGVCPGTALTQSLALSDEGAAKSLAKAKARPMSGPVVEAAREIDPVCKMKVDPTEAEAAKLTTEHQGKTYYFCNPGCKKKFADEPAKYLGSTEAKAAESLGSMKTGEATEAPHSP